MPAGAKTPLKFLFAKEKRGQTQTRQRVKEAIASGGPEPARVVDFRWDFPDVHDLEIRKDIVKNFAQNPQEGRGRFTGQIQHFHAEMSHDPEKECKRDGGSRRGG